MFITVHAAAAVLIGKNISSAPLAFILGVISHFLLDIPPHGDQKLGKKFFRHMFGEELQSRSNLKRLASYGLVDGFVLILFIIYLFRNFNFAYPDSVSWGLIGGILPDLLVGLYTAGKVKGLKWFFNFHGKNHYLLLNRMKSDLPVKWGIAIQAVIFAILLWLIPLI